jgi:hypothetical protein
MGQMVPRFGEDLLWQHDVEQASQGGSHDSVRPTRRSDASDQDICIERA